jgi:hypothetical protein
MATPQQLKETRIKLRNDFEFYAKHCLKIRTKSGEIKPLVLNRAQLRTVEVFNDQLQRHGKVRMIILKGRQMGLSTLIEAILYWWASQHKATKAIVVTHHSDSTKALFDMTKRYYDNTPEIVRPSTKYSSRRELTFSGLDSSFMVATAGGDSIGRGETLQLAHLSELGFWDAGAAKDNLNGLQQAIPDVKGTIEFIESTANGMSGPFYDAWNNAVSGKSGFVPLFIPWFWDSEYRVPVTALFERTPDEDAMAAEYGLDNEQLMFRRQKVAQSGLDLFKQEYPCFPEEAFITTGRPVFDLSIITRMLKAAPDILRRYTMELTAKGDVMAEHPRGELLVYREADPGDTYYIGADVAMGVKDGDYSVAQVLDGQKRQVACFVAHMHPDYFSRFLACLGHFYNGAKIAVEANNHGLLTVHKLYHDHAYPNVFLEQIEDKTQEAETINLGFKTTMKSKPMIIDLLRAALRDNDITLVDKTTLKEMMTFIVTESGKLKAEEGCHDDCVMALAIANYIHEGIWKPIKNAGNWYYEPL